MGRVRKKRKGAKYNYDKNRRKEWKKAKKLPTIECAQIKEAWDPKKSVKKNLEEMGISADPNQTFKIPKTKDIFISEEDKTDQGETTRKRQPKEHVIEGLEMEASIPLEKTLQLSSEEVKYCIYMLEKYGEDYKDSYGWLADLYEVALQLTLPPASLPRLDCSYHSYRKIGSCKM